MFYIVPVLSAAITGAATVVSGKQLDSTIRAF